MQKFEKGDSSNEVYFEGALLIASAALLSACALTPTDVKLNYKLGALDTLRYAARSQNN